MRRLRRRGQQCGFSQGEILDQAAEQAFVARRGRHHPLHAQPARLFDDARMRGEQQRLHEAGAASFVEHLEQIAQALAAGNREGIQRISVPQLPQLF